MKYLYYLILISVVTACSSTSTTSPPTWYGNPSHSKDTLFAYGVSTNLQDAKVIALSDISFQLYSRIKVVLSKKTVVNEKVHSFSSLTLRNESKLIDFSMLEPVRYEYIDGQSYVMYEVSKKLLGKTLQTQIEPKFNDYSFIYKDVITFTDVIKYAKDNESSNLASLLALKSLVTKNELDDEQYQNFINRLSNIEKLKSSFCFKTVDSTPLVTKAFLSEINRLGISNNKTVNRNKCFNISTQSDFQFSRNGEFYNCNAFINISATNAVDEPLLFNVRATGVSKISYNHSKQLAIYKAIHKLEI